MGAANWFTINPPVGAAVPSSSTTIQVTGGATHVVFDGKVSECWAPHHWYLKLNIRKKEEHVFEFVLSMLPRIIILTACLDFNLSEILSKTSLQCKQIANGWTFSRPTCPRSVLTYCIRLTDNFWNAPQPDGRATYLHLKEAIDHVSELPTCTPSQ